MKKIVFTLALLLMSLSAALAQTWTFGAMSEADKALCAADANWVLGTDRYGYTLALDNAALVANGTELAYAKGLKFTAGAPADKTEGKAKVRLNYGSSRLELNGNGVSLIISSLKAGQKVTVSCASGKTGTARGLNATNITPVSGSFNATSADKVTNVGTVTADGDVVLTTNVGGMNIFSIKVEAAGGGSSVTPGSTDKITHAVARNSKVNQMYVTTKSGDVKYYNTADLTSVKFEGDKAIIAPKSGSENDEYDASVQTISFAKKADQGESGDVENPTGVIQITEAKGWQESAYLKWAPFEGASSYNVYVDGKKIDAQLIRQYASYYRADVLGLKAGTYSVKVVPVNAEGTEIAGENTASNLVVKSYSREGFAHFKYDGVGAYNNDGTLKAGAKVLYITAKTAKTVSTTVNTGNSETITGLQSIIDAYSKGKDKTPIAFRIIGKVNLSDLDHISSSAEGLQIKGAEMNMTFEGVGDDATVYGFGFLLRDAISVEFRNFAIMRCLDDALSLDTDNSHVWIHNMDLFYGKKGGAADQAKGDGTVDIKGDSKYITVAYNRFWDNGKASMCGMKSETGPNYITYHHNWFDHSDSRMARIRTMSVHMYNNYYQHNDVYGVGATSGSSVFMESNYFDATKRPIMSSLQGTDAKGDGTFSGEKGGLIKAYGNVFANKPENFSYIPYSESNTSFDAYEVSDPSQQVPSSVKTLVGGTSYDNFDTNSSLMYAYAADKAADVPSIVEGFYGAGRLNHGDIDFVIPDETVVTNGHQQPWPALASLLDAYTSGVVKVFGESNATGEGGSTEGGSTGGSGSGEGGSTGGSTGGTEGGSTVTPIEGTVTCSFTANGKEAVPSNSAFALTGSAKSVKAEETVIEGTTYSVSLKMESNTEVSFTTSQKMTLYVYYGTSGTNTNVKVDGVKQSGAPTTVVLEAGSHKITKGDSTTVALIKLVPVTE
ncbi:pectate lyase [Segatella copri]|uniref:pectate lyase family protein n=1 Tax=Segatella copri TaxID=165179 RepID=UPI00294AC59F|nr:pectate lyase [Segatella copri]WOG32322.1 pectate lyase [Segatella copri]